MINDQQNKDHETFGEVLRSSTSEYWVGEDGILRCYCLKKSNFDEVDAEENIQASVDALKKFKPAKNVLLMNLGNIASSITSKGRKVFAASPLNKANFSKVALLGFNPVQRVIGSFFTGLSKPAVPTKFFDSETKAVKWLQEE